MEDAIDQLPIETTSLLDDTNIDPPMPDIELRKSSLMGSEDVTERHDDMPIDMQVPCGTWWKDIDIVTYTLVILFAISSWVDMNGLWVELPLLVNDLPEKWNLPSYLVIIIQVANIGPLVYVLAHRAAPRIVHEVPVVYVIISVGAIASILLVLFWDHTSDILGSEHSTALLVLTAFLSLVDCTSSVVYLPYMKRLQPQYMSALYIGEGMSGLVPGVVGLTQGVGGNPRCVNASHLVYNSSTHTNMTDYHVYPVYPVPRFTVEIFFALLFAILCVSGVAFSLVNYLPHCKRAFVPEWNSAVIGAGVHEDTTNLYKSVRQSDRDDLVHSSTDVQVQNTDDVGTSSHSPIKSREKMRREAWLLLLTAWACAWTNAILPATQTYSALPYG